MDTSGVGGVTLRVESERWMESAVDCSRDPGVGLGVPRCRGSGRARLGGRGRGIRELATFSRWTLAGRVLAGRLGAAPSLTLKLSEAGHAHPASLGAGGGWLGGSSGGGRSSPSSVSASAVLTVVLRLLMSARRSDTSLLSSRVLVSLVSSRVDSAPGRSPGPGPGSVWLCPVSKLMSVVKRPSRSWAWLDLVTFTVDWDFFRAWASTSADGVGRF